ncbi:MAG: glycosyltransferase [Desulfarculales bacterium]|jgi:glycosyltransferase involved in cell wall biosynthesis|nr:glycosyltransferase [Desulfarculales bacterium]
MPTQPQLSKIALIFGVSTGFTFALANTLLGFKKYSPNILENTIVYHDGISDTEQNLLNQITPCNFILYNFSDTDMRISNEISVTYTAMMFAHYECFKLLAEYDVVIWNDVDILVQGDITDMVMEAAKAGLGMCPVPRKWFINAHNFTKPVPGFNMNSDLYNSGILVVSKNLPNWENMYRWLHDATIAYGDYLKWPDQGILNLLLQKFSIHPYPISLGEYCRHPYYELESIIAKENFIKRKTITDLAIQQNSAKIIHSYGPEKFWNSPLYFMGFPEWRENNKKWTLMLAMNFSSSHTPAISVVMPTMNAETYLEEAIVSILEQTFTDFELIVVDGGSKDRTLSILQSFHDPRIIVVPDETPNGNISTSLNLGLKKARGKYIARMDADDIALPHRLYTQYTFLEKNLNISLCSSSAYLFQDSFTKITSVEDPEIVSCQLIIGTPIVHPTVMWRKADFEYHGFYYAPACNANEDMELWQRATKYLKFSAVPQTLLLYRDHESKTSKLKTYYATRDMQVLLMGRAFEQLGVSLSRDALLVIDQRDNSQYLDDNTLSAAFGEFCRAARRICSSAQQIYPHKKLGLILLRHLRWIFFSRLDPRCIGGKNYIRALLGILNSCNLWDEAIHHKLWWLSYRRKAIAKIKSKPEKLVHKVIFHPVAFMKYFFSIGKRIFNTMKSSSKTEDKRHYNELFKYVINSEIINKKLRKPS